MVHTLRLDNYSPTPRKLVLGTNSSYGTESIKVERGAGWDGLNLTATWHIPGREEPLRVALLDGDAMDVPPEVTKEAKDGVLVLAGLASGVQRASCNVEYLILEQAGIYGGTDAEPTPELAAQVLEAALQAKADAEAAAEDSAAAKANADKAQADAEKAQQAAENAAADAAKAGPYAEAALAAQRAAEAARDKAITAQQAAENAAAAAAASKSAADTLAAAARAALAAEESKAAANAAANLAGENATAAQQAAGVATAAANYAGQSASDAAASKAAAARDDAVKAQTAAQAAAKTAQDAQSAAEKARDDAQTAQQGAEAARDAAAGSAEAAAKSEENAKQSADMLAESVENVAANTAAVAELKEKKAEIDDTAVGANAWSSKRIIDMFCPPLEESGNPVVCYPVAGYPLVVKASWEPVQEGSGTPSPENIRPIKGRDSVTVERCGENLLPFGERLENIYIQQIMTSDDLLLLSKACAGQKVTLTFSVETQNIAFNDAVEDQWRKRIGFECCGTLADGTETYSLQCWLDNRDGELTKNGKKTKTVTVTMPKLANGDITFYAQNIKSGSFVAYDFGIYAGTTAPTTYTPYIGQTNTLTLPETVYGGEVDAVTGGGDENIKVLTLDGNELKFSQDNVYVNLPLHSAPGIATNGVVCCSHFDRTLFGVNTNYEFCFLSTSNMTNLFANVDDLNAYLAAQYAAGTPVQIVYKLKEPEPFTATGTQTIPALAGVNTVLTDADSATVTGRADPIKQITDLEAAVASIN